MSVLVLGVAQEEVSQAFFGCLEGAQESMMPVAGTCESTAVWNSGNLDTNAMSLACGRHHSCGDSNVLSSTSQLILFQRLFVQVEYHAQWRLTLQSLRNQW